MSAEIEEITELWALRRTSGTDAGKLVRIGHAPVVLTSFEDATREAAHQTDWYRFTCEPMRIK